MSEDEKIPPQYLTPEEKEALGSDLLDSYGEFAKPGNLLFERAVAEAYLTPQPWKIFVKLDSYDLEIVCRYHDLIGF